MCVPGCVGIGYPLQLAALTFGRHRLGNSFGRGFAGDGTFGFGFCCGLELHFGSVVFFLSTACSLLALRFSSGPAFLSAVCCLEKG